MSGDRLADRVRSVFGDVGEVAARLQEQRLGAPLEPFAQTADLVVAAAQRERERVVGHGIDGLVKVASGRDHELDADERFGLEAIVLLEGRPAILVQDGDFAPPPPKWARLAERRAEIRAVIARCGRVEVSGHPELDWIGTAFLVAPGIVMTNRHVVRELASRGTGGTWTLRSGVTSRLELLAEQDRTGSLAFAIVETVGVHDARDLALLRVEGTSSGGQALPGPLTVAAAEPPDLFGRAVYVIGYPAWDGRRNEPEEVRRLFMDIFNVKRLMPGRLVGYSTEYAAIEHDCSTLGGNSGSPVVDLDTQQVVGLHFGGRFGVGNYAVPLWALADDPLFAAAGVSLA